MKRVKRIFRKCKFYSGKRSACYFVGAEHTVIKAGHRIRTAVF